MTIVEMVIATAVTTVLGGIAYSILHTGTILFAKNTSVNVAHQAARVAVLSMEHDLHSAVSIPQLVDTDRNPVSASLNAPAAGIAFHVFAEGPFEVVATAAGGQKQIRVNSTGYLPKVGQRFNLPLHQIEANITAVSGAGTSNCTLTLATNLPWPVEITHTPDGSAQTNALVTGFTTERLCYVVRDRMLRYYSYNDSAGKILANNITSPTPFSVPQSAQGALYNRFVAAINLSTADSGTSNRGFKAANMFLNAMVPYRAKLCFSQ